LSERDGHRPLAGLFALACALACSSSQPATAAPSPAAERPRVVVRTGSGEAQVTVELAQTAAEQERGLMFRERIGQDEGMLFVFPEDGERVFWMKNTLIPLDMIFIDGLGRIVGLVARAEPRTETPRRSGGPCRYVLEVAGGFADEHGVKIGDRVVFRGTPGPAP
jgi:uncharacterized membrane protein (UPF0127 family)